jgi:hydrogenase maturation protease
MNQGLCVEVKDALLPSPSGKTAYILVGNALRGDDGAGVFIAENLPADHDTIIVINAGDSPERIFYRVLEERPVKTVIIDAADFNGMPGEVRTFSHSRLHEAPLSTHRFPLAVIAQLIAEDLGCEVHVVGIQIRSANLGSPMDPCVEESAGAIIDCILMKEETHYGCV